MSANEQKRAHYHQVAKAKKLVGDQVCALAKSGRIPLLAKCMVEIIWYVKDRRKRDADGLQCFLKAALDGLVQADVLTDDHYGYVPRVCMEIIYQQDRPPHIDIVITEME